MAHRKNRTPARKLDAAKPRSAASTEPVIQAPAPVKAQAEKKPVEAAASPARVVEAAKPALEAVRADIEPIINHAVSQGVEIMNTETTKNVETGKIAADRMNASFAEAGDRAKAAAEKGTRMFEEATELTKGNVEALVASSKIAAQGVESMGQEAAEFGRRSFEEASAALRSFAEVKSPVDFFRLQSEFAKSRFEAMIAESSKLSERMIKLAGDVAQPLASRYSVAAERAKTMAM